jgi:hypothetical protein
MLWATVSAIGKRRPRDAAIRCAERAAACRRDRRGLVVRRANRHQIDLLLEGHASPGTAVGREQDDAAGSDEPADQRRWRCAGRERDGRASLLRLPGGSAVDRAQNDAVRSDAPAVTPVRRDDHGRLPRVDASRHYALGREFGPQGRRFRHRCGRRDRVFGGPRRRGGRRSGARGRWLRSGRRSRRWSGGRTGVRERSLGRRCGRGLLECITRLSVRAGGRRSSHPLRRRAGDLVARRLRCARDRLCSSCRCHGPASGHDAIGGRNSRSRRKDYPDDEAGGHGRQWRHPSQRREPKPGLCGCRRARSHHRGEKRLTPRATRRVRFRRRALVWTQRIVGPRGGCFRVETRLRLRVRRARVERLGQ